MSETNEGRRDVGAVLSGDGVASTRFIKEGRAVAAGQGWEWLVAGFAFFKKQPGIWILQLIIYALFFVGIGLLPVIGSLANLIVTPIFVGGLMIGCKVLDVGGTLETGHLFAGFSRNAGKLAVLGVLTLVSWVAVLIVVGLLMGGSAFGALMRGDANAIAPVTTSMTLALLVALALSVPIYMALWFAPALVVLHEMPAVEALKASFAACLKNTLPFLVYGVLAVVATMIAMIPFGLGLLVLMPVIVASLYSSYRDVFFAG
jgi:hypothetical protein